jgi:selenocysteine lyase/cysteine desulfurase
VTDFNTAYPAYAATSRLDELRATEYPYLDAGGHVYLDYTGAGLAADAQLRAHAARVRSACFGNPHSENPTSRASTELIEETRGAVLAYFNARADEYAVIFTPNATGACRLVGEAYPFGPGARLVLSADNHNSANGIREFARRRGATTKYVPVRPPDLRGDDDEIELALARGGVRSALRRGRRGLFVFPAQSNFTGVQHPLSWIGLGHAHGYDVLLDAAAYVPANRLDLGQVQPDFVTVSWYKVFGYPTGVGCLIARREALGRLRRPWFSGGTIWAVSVQGNWHKLAEDESAFEDGTLNFLNIPDIAVGLSWIRDIGIDLIHQRVMSLTGWLLDRLGGLHHENGRPMTLIYGPRDTQARGGTVTFNFLDPHGMVVDERSVARDADAAGISLRTGCFCNPGAGEHAFSLTKRSVTGSLRSGLLHRGTRTVDDYLDLLGLPTGGAIRVSLGLASNLADVERFLVFAEETYRDREPDREGLSPRIRC